MMRKLRPTQVVESVHEIDLAHLQSLSKRALIFDLDNTLCRRGTKTPDSDVKRYISQVQAAGFRIGILTNRRRNAEDPIVSDLREYLPVVSAARKPSREGYVQILRLMSACPEETVMIGDKRWTDIWGANRMGIHSIRVRTYPRFPSP
ncbi:HAD-IIIA family hydrolase [Candidatus Bipolaricaulota bacterium]|nr:HAD-IIIA family hydrolase [Candidatus Bipolaricaulota bacterium]